MPFSKVRWITFDAGGTLLFPNPSVGEIYAEVLSRHGHQREPAQLEASFLQAWKEDVRTCMPRVTAESEKERWRGVVACTFCDLLPLLDFDALFQDLWVAFCQVDRWRLPNYTEETLCELRARGYRLALLSNWDDRLRPLVRGIGLEKHFEEIFVSCEIGFEKPDPRIFAAVEERIGAAGETILHIGDSHHHDVLGAHARGWKAIQAFAGFSPEGSCLPISCLSELLDLLPARSPALQES
jgi:putative hydrolase of the HAD superfamily